MVKTEIFKVQRPLNGSGLILIYNKSRSVFSQIGITQELAKFMGTSYKIYVEGYIDSQGMLQITQKVNQQRW